MKGHCIFLLLSSMFAKVTPEPEQCQGGGWRCGNNNLCIWREDRCDGDDDCGDGSDEHNCEQWMCPLDRWKCSNNRCVSLYSRCDGDDDCGDGSDEDKCDQWQCPADRWGCDNNRCISLHRRCDGGNDCGDNSDEQNCGRVQIICPRYVMENASQTCQCRSRTLDTHAGVTVTWPGHSRSDKLTLVNVQRKDNGTQYTCEVTAGGVVYQASYTLLVAFGPHAGDVRLEGPTDLISNGSQTFTLTCNAADVYPTPYYTWGGVACNNRVPQNVCVFTPNPEADDMKTVTCTAVSIYGGSNPMDLRFIPTKIASKELQLQFSYPPLQNPDIQLQVTERDYIRTGDKLTCTVTGGKPLVDSVHFYCIQPHLPDETDNRNATSVSSSLTATLDQSSTNTTLECFCSTTWNFEQHFYKLSSTKLFINEHPPKGNPLIQKHTQGREFLRSGDVLTCTVSEGKPIVESVHFYCINPDLPDGTDQVFAESVSSSVRVNSTGDNAEVGMTCFCNATWIRPESYQLASTAVFLFEEKAVVETFSFNGTNQTYLVDEDDLATLNLICVVSGRPLPNVTITKDQKPISSADVFYQKTGNWSHEAVLTLSDVQCRDMGTFTCTADNSVTELNRKSILLNVACKESAEFWKLACGAAGGVIVFVVVIVVVVVSCKKRNKIFKAALTARESIRSGVYSVIEDLIALERRSQPLPPLPQPTHIRPLILQSESRTELFGSADLTDPCNCKSIGNQSGSVSSFLSTESLDTRKTVARRTHTDSSYAYNKLQLRAGHSKLCRDPDDSHTPTMGDGAPRATNTAYNHVLPGQPSLYKDSSYDHITNTRFLKQ